MPNREKTPGNGGQPQRHTVSYPAPHSSSPAARQRASKEASNNASISYGAGQSVWNQAQQNRQQASKLNAERNAQRANPAGNADRQRVTRQSGQPGPQRSVRNAQTEGVRGPQRSGARPEQRSASGGRGRVNPNNPRLQSFVREPDSSPRKTRNGQAGKRPSVAETQRKDRPVATQASKRPSAADKQRALPSRRQSDQAIIVRRAEPGTNAKPRRSSNSGRRAGVVLKVALAAVVGIGALCAAGLGAYSVATPATFNIKVNNQLKTVDRFTSINSLIEDGIASPVPGDHLAVDGSVLEAGGGIPYHATVNGEEPRFTFLPLSSGDEVVITDGEDTNEKYTSSEQVIEADKVEDGFGAVHGYVPGSDGLAEVRTGKESGLTAEVVITPAEPHTFYEYNADPGSDKVIALTFDDGPWEGSTDEVLDILDRYGVKATFFTIGNQISEHEDTILRMHQAGHQICTHSWSHASGSGNGVDMTRMTSEEQVAEVTKGLEAIEAVTGVEASNVFRAPGGNYTGEIVWTLQEYVSYEVGWNVDTEDWTRPGAEVIANRIMNAKPGHIVLMHDGGGDRSQTVAALEMAIPYLQEQGYTFVTIDELLAYNRPVDMMAQ